MKKRILFALSLVALFALCLGVVCSASTVIYDPSGGSADLRHDQLAPDVISAYGFYDDGFVLYNDSTYSEEYYVWITDVYSFGEDEELELQGFIDDTYGEDYLHHIIDYYGGGIVNYIDFTYNNLDPVFAYSGAPGSSFGYDPVYFGYGTSSQDSSVELSVEVELSWYDDDGNIATYSYVNDGAEVSSGLYHYTFELGLSSVVEVALVEAGFVPGSISPARNIRVDSILISFYCSDGFKISDGITYYTCNRGSAGLGLYNPPDSLNIIRPEVNPDIFSWLKSSVQSFLDTRIFGENITLGAIISLLLAVPLVVWFLKLVAGG